MAEAVAYYNEVDPYRAQWLRNLIDADMIAPGDVDERDIRDIRPDDVAGYTQCHFFAGIGVWSYALRLAGWPDDQAVWTGSPPCQSFSAAGRRTGFDDERHLWPAMHHLIGVCRPAVCFGEQVASPHGLAWMDVVQADLEASRYAVGAFDLSAAGVGAPHARQRLWYVADARGEGWREVGANAWRGAAGSAPQRMDERSLHGRSFHGAWGQHFWVECADGRNRPIEPGTQPLAHGATQCVGRLGAYGDAIVAPLAAEFVSAYMEARHA
jgi:DNA (cytosine-5)-methyltransferase 1